MTHSALGYTPLAHAYALSHTAPIASHLAQGEVGGAREDVVGGEELEARQLHGGHRGGVRRLHGAAPRRARLPPGAYIRSLFSSTEALSVG